MTDILQARCPRCRSGRIYTAWKMAERCPECGLTFEREQGYFLGAMYISFPLGVVVIAIFGTLLWWLARWSLERSVVVAIVLFLPLAPFLTRLSRILWIYLDQAIDPDPS